jgi:hypothetical protein
MCLAALLSACTSKEIVYVQADGGATVASSSAASGGSGGAGGATSASSGGIGGQGGSGGTMGLGGSGGQGGGEAGGAGGVGAGGSAASVGGSSGTGGVPTVLVKCRTWSENQVYTCCDITGASCPSPYFYFIQHYEGQDAHWCYGSSVPMNEPTPCPIGNTCYVDKGGGTSYPGSCE